MWLKVSLEMYVSTFMQLIGQGIWLGRARKWILKQPVKEEPTAKVTTSESGLEQILCTTQTA